MLMTGECPLWAYFELLAYLLFAPLIIETTFFSADEYLPQNEFELLNSVLCDGIQKDKEVGVASVAFDTHEELVWIGTKSGHVSEKNGLLIHTEGLVVARNAEAKLSYIFTSPF